MVADNPTSVGSAAGGIRRPSWSRNVARTEKPEIAEKPNKSDTSSPAGYPREPHHISVRDGDKIYVNRRRFRLERSLDSSEELEVIDVISVSPLAQKPS